MIRHDQTLQKLRTAWEHGASRLLLGLCVLLALIVLPGCQPKAKSGVTIQLSTWGSAQEIAVLQELVQEFERQHPGVHVEMLHIPENYFQKLHILIAGGMTPDVMFVNSLNFPVYAAHGVFADLTPYLEGSRTVSRQDFYPPALAAFTWTPRQGSPRLGAMPRDISNLVIFYNKAMLADAGVPAPQAGWTWEEFVRTAQRLTQDTDGDGDPDVFGVSFYAQPPLFWLPFVWSAGGDLFGRDVGELTVDAPATVRGLQFYADLRHRYHVAPRQEESGAASMSQMFLQKRLAMLVSGRWSVPVLREQATFDWDVVPFPVGPSGQSRVGIDASGYAMAARTEHPRESWALIRFLTSRSAIETVTESGLIVPARPDVAASDVFLNPARKPRHSRVFLDVIPEGVPTRTPPRWNEFAEELGLALQPVFNGQQSAQDAMRRARPRLEPLVTVGGGS